MAQEDIEQFLAGEGFAVVGASRDRSKYGNRVLRAYVAHGRRAHPVHPTASEVEGIPAVPRLQALTPSIHGVSVITQPHVTERVIDEAIALGIRHIWMQPGAEHDGAMRRAREAGVNVIGHGPCVLVALATGNFDR